MKRTILAVSILVMIAIVLSLMVGVVNALAESKPVPPIAELDIQTVPSRTIYNVCTNPQVDYNGDGTVNAEDAHVDLYYDGRFGPSANIGIFTDLRCDDDTSTALQRVFMLANTTRRVFNVSLYMWTYSLHVAYLETPEDCQEFDAWIIGGWQDYADCFEFWCNPVWGHVEYSHYEYTGPTPITAYCVDPEHDFNGDGTIDRRDAWVQIEMPYRDTPPVDIELTRIDVTTGTNPVVKQRTLAHNVRSQCIRLFVNVASGIHNVHTIISVHIPAGEPYEGDLLEYATWSEDGVCYRLTGNMCPTEYN